MSSTPIREVIQRHQSELLRIAGVQGIGAVQSRDATGVYIGVYVTTKKRPEGIPAEIEGYRVEIIHTQGFQASGPD